MPEVIECVYEDGVLKPFGKINLKENTRVRVILKESVVEKTFGILKVSKDEIAEAFKELEDEWPCYFYHYSQDCSGCTDF